MVLMPPFYLMVLSLILMISCRSMSVQDQTWISSPLGLKYQIKRVGTGPQALMGKDVTIHETTSLLDGQLVFDSWAINHPITFTLGAKQVIEGVERSVLDMRVGEHRKVIIPPLLSKRKAYPANAGFTAQDTLLYEIWLLKVE